MPSEISRFLAEVAERGVERRRRCAEIREESRVLLQRVGSLGYRRVSSTGSLQQEREADLTERPAPVPPVSRSGDTRLEVGILDEVQAFLRDMDEAVRDQWSEDDTRIVCSLQDAWRSARRKGYSLAELQVILAALARPAE